MKTRERPGRALYFCRGLLLLGMVCAHLLSIMYPASVFNMLIPEAAASTDGPQILPRYGRVLARGLELGPGGKPIWVEIKEDGSLGRTFGEAVDVLQSAQPMSAEAYRFYSQLLANFRQQNPELARGSYILSREQFDARNDFGSVTVARPNPAPGQAGTESVIVAKPASGIAESTQSFLIRANGTIADPRLLGSAGPVLMQFPVDMREGVYQVLDGNIKTVLLSKAGIVLQKSQYNIGFKSGYFHSNDPKEEGDPLGPVAGAKVEAGPYTYKDIPGVSSAKGFFGYELLKQSCPGFQYIISIEHRASFVLRDFNPEAPGYIDLAWASNPDFLACSGLSALFPPVSGFGLGRTLQLDIKGILEGIERGLDASQVANANVGDIYVDSVVFSGQVRLSNGLNGDTTAVPLGETTRYGYVAPDFSRIQTPHLDLNVDGTPDFVVMQGETQRVYFSGTGLNAAGQVVDANGRVITRPDVERRSDVAQDFSHQGLLEAISEEDLLKTDLYIYRVSNGQRVSKQKDIQEDFLLTNAEDHFWYRIPLPGKRFSDLGAGGPGVFSESRAERREAWQEAQGLAEELRPFHSDHLRPGELVKIIAINRPTGYIGSTVVTVQTPQQGRLDFDIKPIILYPPNLKVKAERVDTVASGLTQGERHRYQIGFEGSALTTDTLVSIHTEWFDSDGTPLPEDLEGYTGRMAKVTGANSLVGGDVATFAINPGSHMQVLRFAGDILGSEHFYVHVSGSSSWDNPGIGAASQGPLQYRPRLYAPIKVALFDEPATRQQQNQNAYNRRNGLPGIEVQPVYQWFHRPEMQFSVYELRQLDLNYQDDNGQTQTIDLLTQRVGDTLNLFDSDLDYIELLYDLIESAQEVLEPLGSVRELIFAVGEDEALVTIGEDRTLRFENLDHLAELDGSDFLSIRLYQNSDAANILWHRDLEGLAIDSSDNPESDAVNSFVITTQSDIIQTDGTSLQFPQDPFVLQLLNPISSGDSYEWEIVIPDTQKYGTFQFTSDAPTGTITTNTITNSNGTQRIERIWSSGSLIDPKFRQLKFRPVELSPRHTPVAYTQFSGGTSDIDIVQKNPRYTYHIKVKVNSTVLGPRTYTGTIQMDDKDMIRQEFITHLSQVASITDIVRVPLREDLIEKNSLQGVLVGSWSDAEYDYLYEKHMSLLATLVRNGFINQQAQTYATPGGGTETLPSGAEQIGSLRLNSGWRNPERNEDVGGVTTSRHMVGRANDIGTSGVAFYGADTTNRARLMWTLWNTAELLPDSQLNGPRFRWLLEDADANNTPYGTYLAETGIPTQADAPEPGGVPDIVPDIDNRGAGLIDPPDGIPDFFNYASHLHAETKPTRICGNGQQAWDCE